MDPLVPFDRGDRPDPALAGRGRRVLAEIVALWLVTLLAIRGVVALQRGAGLPDWILAAVPLLFIYAPVALCHLRRVDSWSYRLSIPAFSDGPSWRRAFACNARVLALILPPWIVGYHFYQGWLFDHRPGDGWREGAAQALVGVGQPPPEVILGAVEAGARALGGGDALALAMLAGLQVLTLVAYQVFFVAIPEEFFYRGYVQTRLNELWPRRWLIFGAPMGWGAVVACLFFAFGHSLVQVQWWHFATFFPGMVFAWMRERTGGVVTGALFHAACNVLVVLLDNLYGVPRGF
ncbi:CPBP family intramembrane metalloprotease [Myxococcota bacterium]|nr:CPBP family intramembrane metalloprotease [Myxococcota bacterium]